MHIIEIARRGATFVHDGEERRVPFGHWRYGTRGDDSPDPAILVYHGDDPLMDGTSVPLDGNAEARAFHAAYRAARGEPAAGAAPAGDPFAAIDLSAVPTPAQAAAREAEEARRRAEEAARAAADEETRELAAIARYAVEHALRQHAARPPGPIYVTGAPPPPAPPDILARLAAARAALAVPAPPDTATEHPYHAQLRTFRESQGGTG